MKKTMSVVIAILVWLEAVGVPLEGRSAASPSGDLRVAFGAIGPNRHPHLTTSVLDDEISSVIFEPLLRYADDLSIEPVLAASYERVNETRWRFRLRPGVRFHDGTPLSSADVKVTLEQYTKARSVSYLYTSWLERVEIVDDLTVDLVTKGPYRLVPAHMAFHSFVIPRSATDPEAFARKPVGTGPYRFVEFVPGARVIVEANPAYWGPKKPHFRRIVFRQIPEDGTRLAALEAGEVDLATSVPPAAIDRLKAGRLQVSAVPSLRSVFVMFNSAMDGPWRDVRVRQALNHAVDREAIRTAVLAGQGAVASAPFAPAVRYVATNLPPYHYDPARARRLLTEAGYPQGLEATLVTPSGRYVKDREIAEAVAGQLEAVGVRLKIAPLEWATYLQQRGKYPLALNAWGAVTGDADFGLQVFDVRNPFNFVKYSNPELQSLMDQGKVTFDESRLQAIYGRAQASVWKDAPAIFLFALPDIVALSPKLKGFVHRPDERTAVHNLWREE